MESKNYSISKMELAPTEAKKIMTKLLDAQINTYQLQSIQCWERSSQNGDKWKNEIEKLKNFKKRLTEDIENFESSDELLCINFSLDLDIVSRHETLKVG